MTKTNQSLLRFELEWELLAMKFLQENGWSANRTQDGCLYWRCEAFSGYLTDEAVEATIKHLSEKV